MPVEKEKDISRIKEVESINLARAEIRDEVIETKKAVEKDNDVLANRVHQIFKDNNIKSFDIVGAIGAGKTALLEKITEKLSSQYRILVICGDITTRVDADRIEKHNAETVQINTGRECALNAYHIHQIIKNKDLNNYDLVFIENVGNLICPAAWDIGAQLNVVVFSITEGEYVIKKHPIIFKNEEIAIINKCDLDGLGFDSDILVEDASKIKSSMKIIRTSAKTGTGVEELIAALGIKVPKREEYA